MTYTLMTWVGGNLLECRRGLSWASVCGCLQHVDDCDHVSVQRSDGVTVLRYAVGGLK